MRIVYQALALLLVASPFTYARVGDLGSDEQGPVQEHDDHDADDVPRILKARQNPVRGRYIMRVSKQFDLGRLFDMISRFVPQAELLHEYTMDAFHGLAVAGIPEHVMHRIMRLGHGIILEVEEDAEVTLPPHVEPEEEEPATPAGWWGLDRIDARLGLDGNYDNDFNGKRVDIYILDTGVRITHKEFGGRAKRGMDFTREGLFDGHGHGTHVAGIAAGKNFGVAKRANIIPVKVLNSDGRGHLSDIIMGILWVKQRHLRNKRKSVANMSFGGGISVFENAAVEAAMAAGVVMVAAAGNDSGNACDKTPASAVSAITVGSTDINDVRSPWSNTGPCVDIFAPGSSILSSVGSGDTDLAVWSGTSMAAPHVAGAAALLLQADPTAEGLRAANNLINMATPGVIQDVGNDTANLLLYTGMIVGTPQPEPGDPHHPLPVPWFRTTISMELVYDYWYGETSFELWTKDIVEGTWHRMESFPAPTSRPQSSVVVTRDLPDGYYAFDFYDSYGDGICCLYGNGSFTLSDAGAGYDFSSGGEFGSWDSVEFLLHAGRVEFVQEYPVQW